MNRAVIYARHFSSRQSGQWIVGQLRVCKEHAGKRVLTHH